MEIALLVGLCLLLALALTGVCFTYSYYRYNHDRLFSKVKFPILMVVLVSILFVCLLIIVILVGMNYKTKSASNPYFSTYLALSSILLAFSIGYIIAFICIYLACNKNKIDYLEIPNVDWKQKEKELMAKVGDMEAIKTKLSSKNLKYYTSMLEYYKSIVSRVGQKNLPISEIIADIVTFNDSFTHKWCSKLNVYQLQLTYKFCAVFEKNPGQK